MKYKFLFLLLFATSFVFSQSNYRTGNYYMVIKGTSNLHNWESKVNEVRANGGLTTDATGLKSINWLNVEIPIKTIKSEKGSIMDNKTYDALKADKFPNISYKLEKVNSLNKSGDGYDIQTSGYITVGGATNKLSMYVRGKVNSDGSIAFSGSKKLKMTDFGIKPPTALMGTMTVGDEVEIAFQVSLKQ